MPEACCPKGTPSRGTTGYGASSSSVSKGGASFGSTHHWAITGGKSSDGTSIPNLGGATGGSGLIKSSAGSSTATVGGGSGSAQVSATGGTSQTVAAGGTAAVSTTGCRDPEYTQCGTGEESHCSFLASDPMNCGRCGHTCDGRGAYCSRGSCKAHACAGTLALGSPPAAIYGDSPVFAAIGDVNGDGKLDLAVVAVEDDTVSIALGAGDGTFISGASYRVGSFPMAVTIRDLNNDGREDVAVANHDSGSVGVMMAQADGALGSMQEYEVGWLTASLGIGDLNGDGWADIVAASASSSPNGDGELSVLLGLGDGSFAPSKAYVTPQWLGRIVLRDRNGDGRSDVVSVSGDVFLGQSDGSLSHQATYDMAGTVAEWGYLAIGDLNGDDHDDLAAVRQDASFVSVLLGASDGTFSGAESYPAGENPDFVAIGDLNGDAKVDLVVSNLATSNHSWRATWSVLLGRGDGAFDPRVDYNLQLGAFVPGDMNQDGHLDLAGTSLDSPLFTVALGQEGGGLPAIPPHPLAQSTLTSFAVGDLDSDRIPEMIAVSEAGELLVVMRGKADGKLVANAQYRTGLRPTSVATADLNRDGALDVVVANGGSDTVSILFGGGDGTLAQAVDFATAAEPSSVVVGDLNADGWPDLLVGSGASDTVSALLNRADGTFASRLDSAFGAVQGVTSLQLADPTGDSVLDVYVSTRALTLLLRGLGDGTFAREWEFDTHEWSGTTVGDLDGNRHLDLVALRQDLRYVHVWTGRDDVRFDAQDSSSIGNAKPLDVAIGDVDGDRINDLVVNTEGGVVRVLLGYGDGNFSDEVAYAVGTNSTVLADFDADGRFDLGVAEGSGMNAMVRVLHSSCQ